MAYTLLLADDSVTIQRVIELTFADEDIKVIAVGDGQQAIDRIEANPPDIVLADIGMPKRDGYEVSEYVKSRPKLAHIPVVLLTGAFEPLDQAKAAAVKCNGVLGKPFEPQVVINKVKQLLGVAVGASFGHAAVGAHATRVAEPAAVGAAGHTADREPAAHSSKEPASEFTMRPQASAADASLDAYFDQLDAAFSKLDPPSTETAQEAAPVASAAPAPPDRSLEFDWAPPPPQRGFAAPETVDESVTGLKQTGAGEFEWVAPGQAAKADESFDFSSVNGVEAGAPRASIGADAPVQSWDLASEPVKPTAGWDELLTPPIVRPVLGGPALEVPGAAHAAPGVKDTGADDFEQVTPAHQEPVDEIDAFDFSSVTGAQFDAPIMSMDPDAPLQPPAPAADMLRPSPQRNEFALPPPVVRPIVHEAAPEVPKEAPKAAAPPAPAVAPPARVVAPPPPIVAPAPRVVAPPPIVAPPAPPPPPAQPPAPAAVAPAVTAAPPRVVAPPPPIVAPPLAVAPAAPVIAPPVPVTPPVVVAVPPVPTVVVPLIPVVAPPAPVAERPASVAAPPAIVAPPVASPPLPDAFASLLALEREAASYRAATASHPAPSSAPAPAAPAPLVVTDALIEQVATQVLERLSDKLLRETVAEIVSRVAERLVRDEIERIKKGE